MTEAKITLVGNAGKDPEIRFLTDGTPVASVSVAHTERKKQGDQWVDGETIWYRVTCWREQAEALVEGVKKGDQVIAVGKFKIGSFEKDGETRMVPEVVADLVGVVCRPVKKASKEAGPSW